MHFLLMTMHLFTEPANLGGKLPLLYHRRTRELSPTGLQLA